MLLLAVSSNHLAINSCFATLCNANLSWSSAVFELRKISWGGEVEHFDGRSPTKIVMKIYEYSI